MSEAMRLGMIVAVALAILTIVEYIFAVNVGSDDVRFVGLSAAALAKAAAIIYYFMHVYRVWRAEAH